MSVCPSACCLLILSLSFLCFESKLAVADFQKPPFEPLSLWNLPPPSPSSPTGGYPPLPSREVSVNHQSLYIADNTTLYSNYTYNHYAKVLTVDDVDYFGMVIVAWANGWVDEDADGQQVLYRFSTDHGMTFSGLDILFPAVTDEPKLKQLSSLERTISITDLISFNETVWAVADVYGRANVGANDTWVGVGFGRIVRSIDIQGQTTDDACWLQASMYVDFLKGTKYEFSPLVLPTCDPIFSNALNRHLAKPYEQPAYSWSLLSDNSPLVASDQSQLFEPTHAHYVNRSETGEQDYIYRFWRALSGPSQGRVMVEWNFVEEGKPIGWFNGTDMTPQDSPYPRFDNVVPTNIPDANSRSFFGRLPEMKWNFLVFNPTSLQLNFPVTTVDRCPLVMAVMRTDHPTFDEIYTIRDAQDLTIPTKYEGYAANSGWQYPDVSVSDRNRAMFVVYSENKNNIWITRISMKQQEKKVEMT